jgi:glycosyltransferase involved in cell wall biosynthesis
MMVLLGHPTGNPNSHQAALAHFETGRLEAFCVPWMPSSLSLRALERVGRLRPMSERLRRRHFAPLAGAPKVQGRLGEFGRLLTRAFGRGDERLSYQANDWLMRTMRRECRRASVTAVHAYEDCSLWQFVEAKRLGKACIYDMPIGYYPAWELTQAELARRYAEWLPAGGLPSSRYVRPEQKREEMKLADLVLAPSAFVLETIRRFHPDKRVALARYGIDVAAWFVSAKRSTRAELTFLFAGQCSLRKGVPLLLEAWKAAQLKGARLQLVGSWQLAQAKLKTLPAGAQWAGPVSGARLRELYHQADILVLPSYFEGRSLAIGEALASGLPVLTTAASGADDLIDGSCGRLVPTGSLEALVEGLRWFHANREKLPEMSVAARARAEGCTWANYRRAVAAAVAPFALGRDVALPSRSAQLERAL